MVAALLFLAQLVALVAAAQLDRHVLGVRGFATDGHPSSAIAAIFPFVYLWKRSVLYSDRDFDAGRPFARHMFMIAIAGFAVFVAGLWGIPIRLLLSR